MNRFFHCSAKKAAGDIHRECATIIKNTLYDEGIVNRTPYYGGNLAFNFLVSLVTAVSGLKIKNQHVF